MAASLGLPLFGTMNLGGVEQVGRRLASELEALGFETRWVSTSEVGRAGHLIATHKGKSGGKRLMLLGHIDTVFERDNPCQGWKVTGDIAVGPGVARRSSNFWTIRVKAPSGHSSVVCRPTMGRGAIYELARILDAFRRELPEPHLTYNVGLVLGGAQGQLGAGNVEGQASGKPNVISAEAVARGDIRTLSREQEARVRAHVKAIVAQHIDKAEAEITFEEDAYPPMAPTEGSKEVLAKLNEVNATLGLPFMPPANPDDRGAGDISFVAPFVDGLVGLGVYGGVDHAPGEWTDLKSFSIQAKRAALLMTRLSKEPRP